MKFVERSFCILLCQMQEGDEAPCFHFCKSLRLEGKDTAHISFSCGPAFEVSLSSVIPETHQL